MWAVLGVHVCVRAAVSLGGFFSLESSLVLLEEVLSLEGGGSTSRMCTLVTAHGAPIGLGSGRSERMPIT